MRVCTCGHCVSVSVGVSQAMCVYLSFSLCTGTSKIYICVRVFACERLVFICINKISDAY